MRCEAPSARARFNDRNCLRAAEAFPHCGELASQQTAKDGMHVGSGVVISETRLLGFAVITVGRMVEAFAHVIRECERAVAADPLGEEVSDPRHARYPPATVKPGPACIPFPEPSKTSSSAPSKSPNQSL